MLYIKSRIFTWKSSHVVVQFYNGVTSPWQLLTRWITFQGYPTTDNVCEVGSAHNSASYLFVHTSPHHFHVDTTTPNYNIKSIHTKHSIASFVLTISTLIVMSETNDERILWPEFEFTLGKKLKSGSEKVHSINTDSTSINNCQCPGRTGI